MKHKNNKKLNYIIAFIITFLPILIIYLSSIYGFKMFSKSYLTSDYNFIVLIGSILSIIISVISILINTKLNKKVIKIIFSIISIIILILSILVFISFTLAYKSSKEKEKIVNDYIDKIENVSVTYLKDFSKEHKNGDYISSDEVNEVIYANDEDDLYNDLDNKDVYCKWYIQLIDIDKKNIEVNISCTSFSDYDFSYRSKNFKNEVLEEVK